MNDFFNYLTLIITQIVSYSTIYALASLGMVVNGRAGIFNISGEGVMATAAAVAFAVGIITQNWIIGAFAAVIAGAVIGFLFAMLHEEFKVDQFIIGIAFIIAGTALGDLIYKIITANYLVVPQLPSLKIIAIPVLSKIPLIGGFFRQSIFTYMSYLLLIGTWLFMWKTKKGLEFRSVGENPKAADVVGIPVIRIRIISTILTGMIMGLAGAYLPLVVTGSYSIGIIAGRGLMAIGIAIFANWKSSKIFTSALIFATFEVIAINLQFYVTRQNIFLVQMIPFIAVILIMVVNKQSRFPSWIGEPYNRE